MNLVRIALANLRFPATPEESITVATGAIDRAAGDGAAIICFPECFVPGYRRAGRRLPPPDPQVLERAWSAVAAAAAKSGVAVILGTCLPPVADPSPDTRRKRTLRSGDLRLPDYAAACPGVACAGGLLFPGRRH